MNAPPTTRAVQTLLPATRTPLLRKVDMTKVQMQKRRDMVEFTQAQLSFALLLVLCVVAFLSWLEIEVVMCHTLP